MTDLEARYNINAETCRAVGHFLEVRRKDLKDCKHGDQRVIISNEIYETQFELDELYDDQIELFVIIKKEKRDARKKAIEQMLMTKKMNTKDLKPAIL